ncbi:MAG: hypothetical protein ACJ75J_12525, partial [Cytophagaceae bacterium]
MTYESKSKKLLISEIKKLKAQLKKTSSLNPTAAEPEESSAFENLPLPYILFTEKKILYLNKQAAG